MKRKRQKPYNKSRRKFLSLGIIAALAIFTILIIFFSKRQQGATNTNANNHQLKKELVQGIHEKTGLKEAEGLNIVITHCTACHSAQIITQNRMSKEKWNATIRWMQETQNLWDLGENQEIIVNYLVENYPVEYKGRRENLDQIEWYELKE